MIPQFDIFRSTGGGRDLVWIEAGPTLNAAKSLVKQLMQDRPAHYMILNQLTGQKISIKPGESEWSRA